MVVFSAASRARKHMAAFPQVGSPLRSCLGEQAEVVGWTTGIGKGPGRTLEPAKETVWTIKGQQAIQEVLGPWKPGKKGVSGRRKKSLVGKASEKERENTGQGVGFGKWSGKGCWSREWWASF